MIILIKTKRNYFIHVHYVQIQVSLQYSTLFEPVDPQLEDEMSSIWIVKREANTVSLMQG